MTIRVLAERGQNHSQIARTVGVIEGTVRYHLRRVAEGAVDGRSAAVRGRGHVILLPGILTARQRPAGRQAGWTPVAETTLA